MNIRANQINQSIDPANPVRGQVWVNPTGLIGSPGLAMGPLGLTYTQPVVETYLLTFRTNEGTSVGIGLNNYV